MVTQLFTNDIAEALHAFIQGASFDANLSLPQGAPVAQITATAVNGRVAFSVSGGTPTSGSAQFSWFGQTLTIAFNETAASLTAKLLPILGAGNYSVSGGPWPGTALTVELQGQYAALTPPQVSLLSHALNVGTPAAAVTQAAVARNRFVRWDATRVARPTAAPTVSATGTGGTLPAAALYVQFTWTNTTGETTASPPAVVTLTAGQQVRFNQILAANVAAGATGVNVYINGVLAASIAANAGTGNIDQTDIAAFNTALDGRGVPPSNTAFRHVDGRARLVGFTRAAITTGFTGGVERPVRQLAGQASASSAEIIVGGVVNQNQLAILPGTENDVLAQLGARVIRGLIANGDAVLSFGPFGGFTR